MAGADEARLRVAGRGSLRGVAIGVGAVTVAFAIKLAFNRAVGVSSPFLLVFSSVMIAAYTSGVVGGLLATTLGAVATEWYFVEPVRSFTEASVWHILVFALEGSIVTGICVVARRARDRAEHEALRAREHEETARQGEERHRLLIDTVRDYAIFLLDPKGSIARWNAGAERLTAWTEDDVAGAPFAKIFPTEASAAVEASLARADAIGRDAREAFVLRKDGGRFWADVVLTALRGREGVLVGYSVIVHDLTERKQLEGAVEERAAALEEANRTKDEFLGILSHELRTPINAVLGWTQLLRQGAISGADVDRALATIQRNAAAQAALVEDLLDLSRMLRGDLRIHAKVLDLRETVVSALRSLEAAAAAKRVAIDLRASRVHVHADPERLRQIAFQIASNAVKFSNPDGRIRVEVGERDGRAVLSVEDEGVGIDPAFLPHVFDRFRQADASAVRAHGGLGIGLAVARHLVDLHGGTIAVSSGGHEEGTKVEITFPVAPAPADATEEPVAVRRGGRPSGRMTIRHLGRRRVAKP